MSHPIHACFPKQATHYDHRTDRFFTRCVICKDSQVVPYHVPTCLAHAELHESNGDLYSKTQAQETRHAH